MTRSEIIRSLEEEYARQRERDRQEQEERLREAYGKSPRLQELAEASRALFMKRARSLLSRPEDAETLAEQTRAQARAIRAEQEACLAQAGLPADYLDMRYRCSVCRDTGYVGEGVRQMCACFERRLVDRMYDSARERGTDGQRFEAFSPAMIPAGEKVDGLHTQRQITEAVERQCREYADSYPDTEKLGLTLMGGTGLGKTFLLHCVENRLIERGFSPISVTAYRLFETMRGCHFSDPEKRREFDELLRCDILLIDDLGTEPLMKNITREYLFTLLNERLCQRRHTVAATNLGMKELMEQYGERVFSRLLDTMNVAVTPLRGQDLRMAAGKAEKRNGGS